MNDSYKDQPGYHGGDATDVDGDGDDSVDSRPAAPLDDSRPNDGSDTSTDDGGEVEPDEENQPNPVVGRRNDELSTESEGEVTEGGQMTHIENDGLVVGRRNEDLPTENLASDN